MKRRELASAELDRVVALRRLGASWTKIERETGIPRRAAQRGYKEREKAQSFEGLADARKQVAAEEFRAHVDALSSIAEALADHLRVPQWPGERRGSEEVLESLWRTEFYAGFPHRRVDWREARRKDERVVRRNRLLFASLKEHTRDAVRWELLDAWKKSWDVCVATLDRVSKLGERVMSGHCRQESGFEARVEDDTAKKDATERMLQVITLAVWQYVSSGDKKEDGQVQFRAIRRDRGFSVTAGDEIPELSLRFSEQELADRVATVCNRTVSTVCVSQEASAVAAELKGMKTSAYELEDELDELAVRPLILRTKCDICPA